MRELRDLLAANTSFYNAFEKADPAGMDAVWAQSSDDVCIHPGWEAARGAINVANSWRRLFSSGERLKFALADLHAEIYGEVGIVHCVENIWVAAPRQLVGRAVATNIFRKVDGSWRMVLHHGSPVAGPPDDLTTTPGDLDN